MLTHTREGRAIVTQQEKLETKPDNRWTIYFKGPALFDPFCCRESFIGYLQRAVFISHRTSQVEPSPLLLDTFFKRSTLPWKNRQQTASWSFSWSFFLATIDFQNSTSSHFYMARDPACDFVSPLAASHPKRLAPLAYELVKLDSAVVSIGFSGALSSFSPFSWL